MNTRYIRTIILLGIFVIAINVIVYGVTELNEKQRVKLELDSHVKTLEAHYKVMMHNQKKMAISIFEGVMLNKNVLDILSKVNQTTSKEEKAELRQKLHNMLKRKFEIMKGRGISVFLIVLPDNRVFLRLHKPQKYGDDISNVRYGIKKVNETKQAVSGFEQGKISHALLIKIFLNQIYGKEISFVQSMFKVLNIRIICL